MTVYYQFENILCGITKGVGRDPNLKKLEKMSAKDSFDYLMNNSSEMNGEYLGACLDSCRIGTMTTCAWTRDVRGLMGLIEKWREENGDNENLYHELSIEQVYSKFELPHIKHDKCPRDKKHNAIIQMDNGVVRCGHRSIEMMKPSFIEEYNEWDELSQMKVNKMYNKLFPDHPGPDEDVIEYKELKKRWDSEKPEEVLDVCYAILNDEAKIMSFETVLERMNLQPLIRMVYCEGNGFSSCKRLDEVPESSRYPYEHYCNWHNDKTNMVEFPFDGWTLAHYLMKWKQQKEKFGIEVPWFADRKENWEKRKMEISSKLIRYG